MSTEDNKTRARRFIEEVWNQGNVAVIDELAAPSFSDPGLLPPVQGLEGLKQYVTMYRTAFPDVYFTIDDQIAEGDKVVTRFTATGTQKGELMGIAATGRRATVMGITITRYENGKVVESWSNFDALGMMQQLGVVPSMG